MCATLFSLLAACICAHNPFVTPANLIFISAYPSQSLTPSFLFSQVCKTACLLLFYSLTDGFMKLVL